MKKIILILIFILAPLVSYASTADDFTVNRQSTYDIPYSTTKVLILDLTLPEPPVGETLQLQSIKLHNLGTADHTVISGLTIWQDDSSTGWDGGSKETEAARVLQAPFFDTEISGNFREYSKGDPWQRIFVTLDTKDTTSVLERTLQLQLLKNSVNFTTSSASGPTDKEITGFERKIRHDASTPSVPLSPLAKSGEALSTSTIRWHFTDLSNNEFGFKILDENLNEVARSEYANISYIDETGLQPNTKYSGRRVAAFNDRGISSIVSTAIFPTVSTLAAPEEEISPAEEIPVEEEVSEEVPVEEMTEKAPEEEGVVEKEAEEEVTAKGLRAKIQELQLQLIKLLQMLIEVLQKQLAAVGHSFGALF